MFGPWPCCLGSPALGRSFSSPWSSQRVWEGGGGAPAFLCPACGGSVPPNANPRPPPWQPPAYFLPPRLTLQVPHVCGILPDLSFMIDLLSPGLLGFIRFGACVWGGLLNPPAGRGPMIISDLVSAQEVGGPSGFGILLAPQKQASRATAPWWPLLVTQAVSPHRCTSSWAPVTRPKNSCSPWRKTSWAPACSWR